MEAIERIEVATRTQLAYHHAHAWRPDAYATNPASLPRLVSGPATDPRTHAAFLEKLHVNLQQNGDKPFVRHFKTRYTASAHLPIWMAVELMSLGNITSMYHGCTDDVRDLVARHVGGISNTIFGSRLLTLGRRRVPGRQDVQALARTVEVGIRCVAHFRARSARSASGATAGATSPVV